jgi:hypothetical protein
MCLSIRIGEVGNRRYICHLWRWKKNRNKEMFRPIETGGQIVWECLTPLFIESMNKTKNQSIGLLG